MRVPYPPSDRLCGDCRQREARGAEKTLEQRLAEAGTPRKYAGSTRAAWERQRGAWSASPVLRALAGWPHTHEASSWLVLITCPGYSDAKTQLGTAVLGEAMSCPDGSSPRGGRALRGCWLTQCDWLRDIKASWQGKRQATHPVEPEHVVWRRAATAEVLLLDGFGGDDALQRPVGGQGSQRPSGARSWWRSQMTELLHYREKHLLPTIVTANLTDWRQVRHVHASLVACMDVPLKIMLPAAGEPAAGGPAAGAADGGRSRR